MIGMNLRYVYSFFDTGSVKANGFWAPWGPWTACSGNCGSGTQERERECVAPQGGGAACIGSITTEERFCGLENCPSCK